MSWGFIAIVAIDVVYIANVLGCLVLCETVHEIKRARRYAWFIPIVVFLVPLSCIFDSSFKGKFKFILAFIITPHKNITVAYIIAYALERQEMKEQQYGLVYDKPSRQKHRAHVFADVVENYGVAISAKWVI